MKLPSRLEAEAAPRPEQEHMHEAKLDQLLRVTAPRSERSATAPLRNPDDRSPFDDHLAHAATAKTADNLVSPPAEQRTTSSQVISNPPPPDTLPPSDDEASTAHAADEEGVTDAARKPADGQTATTDSPLPTNNAAQPEDEADDESDSASPEQTSEVDPDEVADRIAVVPDHLEIFAAATEWIDNLDESVTVDAKEEVGSGPPEQLGVQRAVDQRSADGSQPAHPTSDAVPDDAALDLKTIPAQREASPHDSRQAGHATPPEASTRNLSGTAHRLPASETRAATFHEHAGTDQVEAEQSTAPPTHSNGPSGQQQPTFDERRDPSHSRHADVGQRISTDIAVDMVQMKTVAATNTSKLEAPDEVTKAEAIDPSNRPAIPVSARSDTMLNPFTKLQQAGSHGQRSEPASERDEIPRVDAARFVGRVARAFHTAQERAGSLQLRLSPPELGAVRLELVVKDGVLAATLETETPAARRVLLDHLPALRDRLTEQNIRIERFDVDVRREGSSGQQQSAPQQQRDHRSPYWTPPRNPAVPSDRAEETPPASPITGMRMSNSQINLVA